MAQALTARMVRLVRDPILRIALSAQARHTAETRSWQCELDRLEESYREVRDIWLSQRDVAASTVNQAKTGQLSSTRMSSVPR